MTDTIEATHVTDRRFSRPGRRADNRARRREEQSLADALDQDALGLALAPRWRLVDGAPVAEEAALQWPRAFRAASTAGAASATNNDDALAARLGEWMLSRDHGGAGRNIPVSLLLPQALRRDGRLLSMVRSSLARSGMAADMLELRFAEAALLDRSTESLLCLSALRDEGVGIAIDDWGRRYGSLSLLRDVPLSAIRLDPSLTHDVDAGGEGETLVLALAQIAGALGIQVVAQGVDSRRQRDALRGLGIGAATGHFGAVASAPPVFHHRASDPLMSESAWTPR